MKRWTLALLCLSSPLYADTISTSSVFFLLPSTGIVDPNKSHLTKINDNFQKADTFMGTLQTRVNSLATDTGTLTSTLGQKTQVWSDEGSALGGNVTRVDAVGAGITATQSGTTVTVTVTATGGGGGGGNGFTFDGTNNVSFSTISMPGVTILTGANQVSTFAVTASSLTWTASPTFRSSSTFGSAIFLSSVSINYPFGGIGDNGVLVIRSTGLDNPILRIILSSITTPGTVNTGLLLAEATNGKSIFTLLDANGTAEIRFSADYTSATASFIRSGNFGLGNNNPSSKLDVLHGSITVRGENSGIYMAGVSSLSASAIEVRASSIVTQNYTLVFATAPSAGQYLIVAAVNGTNRIIAGGNAPPGSVITAADWNVMNTTGMFLNAGDWNVMNTTGMNRIAELQIHVSTAQVLIFNLSNATANIQNTTMTWTAAQSFSSMTVNYINVSSAAFIGNALNIGATGYFFPVGGVSTGIILAPSLDNIGIAESRYSPFIRFVGVKNPTSGSIAISSMTVQLVMGGTSDAESKQNMLVFFDNDPSLAPGGVNQPPLIIGSRGIGISVGSFQTGRFGSKEVLFQAGGEASDLYASSLTITKKGLIGIGVNPISYKLHVGGDIFGLASATIQGIIISSTGFQVAASTIQGSFMLEGGSIQVRNGSNEFTIAFATMPVVGQKLIVANVTGNRALIASGIDNVGSATGGDFNSLQNPATGFFNMNGFGIGFASQVAGGQLLFDGSSTVRGINISSTGYMVGASTVQGVFLVEGGTFQFRNGTNEFSINFATGLTAGNKLIVASAIGNTYTIASGIDNTGQTSPISASDWNIMNTTGMSTYGDSFGSHVASQPATMQQITASSGIFTSSLNVMGVYTSTTGFQVAASTIQGVLLLEGATIQVRSGANEFSIAFATALASGQVLRVANVTGSRALIFSGAAPPGSPVTISDWNVMNTTGMVNRSDNLGSHIATQPVNLQQVLASSGIFTSSLNVMGIYTSTTGFQVAASTVQGVFLVEGSTFQFRSGTNEWSLVVTATKPAVGQHAVITDVTGNRAYMTFGGDNTGQTSPISAADWNVMNTTGMGNRSDNLGSHIATQPVNLQQVSASSGIFTSSLNIMGIYTSTTGFDVAASTIAGVFLLEGGTFQFRNGTNEFSIAIATAFASGNVLRVAEVTGNRALIMSGAVPLGSPITIGDWNTMNSTNEIKPAPSIQNPATGFFNMNGFGIANSTALSDVGQIIANGSTTVRGIVVSSAGALIGGTTIQGVLLLEGSTIQFRNGANEFSIAFATAFSAGQHLVVTNVTGNRALITGGGDNSGTGSASPITASDWNIMNTTQEVVQNASTWPYVCEIAEAAKWRGRPTQFGAGDLNGLAISTNAAGSRTDRDTLLTIDGLAFAPSTRQYATYQTAFSSSDWVENSTVSWDYSVFVTSGSGTGKQVRFCMQAFSLNKGTDVSANYFASSVCANIPDITANMTLYQSTVSAEMSMQPANYCFGDNPIIFRLSRQPIDGADNLGGSAGVFAYVAGVHINRRWRPPAKVGGP